MQGLVWTVAERWGMAMLPMSAVRPAGQGSPWHSLTPRITPFLDSANANIYRVIGMDRLTCCRGVPIRQACLYAYS